jgi:hypothetical protein
MPSEGDCIICGKWPEKDRWALREMLAQGRDRTTDTAIFSRGA